MSTINRIWKQMAAMAGICMLAVRVWAISTPVPEIERAIVNLELNKAALLSFQQPDQKRQWYYQTKILFIRYLINEDPTLYNSFMDLSKRGLGYLQNLSDKDPERDVIGAEIFFLRGCIKALEKKNVSSALDFKTSCTLIYRNSQKFPENVEQLKLIGIFNVAMGSLPKKLKWLSNVLCFSGNFGLGMQQLSTAASKSKLLPEEAAVMLFYFDKNLLNDSPSAVARATALCSKYPRSILFHYLLLSAYLENREVDKALALVNEKEASLLANKEAERLPVWHYSRAKAHFFKLEYKACIQQIDLFTQDYKGKTLYADALYKKGVALILDNRYEASRPIFHRLTKVESSSFDVDEYARSQATIYLLHEPGEVERQLYAARNLFDGGYYRRSLGILEALEAEKGSEFSQNENCELHYRYARNWQELDSVELARKQYILCTATQPQKALWMKVYAYYYWGKLEESTGDFARAEALYKQALGFDGYDYQSGLEQRCKTALQQLKSRK